MADRRIQQLPLASTLGSSDTFHISQGGIDKKIEAPTLISELSGGTPFNLEIKEDSSESRVLLASDVKSYIRLTNTEGTIVYVPSTASHGWKLGDRIIIRRAGGEVRVAGQFGVTVDGGEAGLYLTEAGQEGTLTFIGRDTWDFESSGTGSTTSVEGVDTIVRKAYAAPTSGNGEGLIIGDDIPSTAENVLVGEDVYDWDTNNTQAPTSITTDPSTDGTITAIGEGFGIPLANTDRLRKLNYGYIAEAARKLRHHEVTSIQWFGDSNSARDSNNTITAFTSAMKKMYPNMTTRVRATSGMTTHRAFAWQSDDYEADLSIINLGTNDALYQRHNGDGGSISDYEFSLRALASREIMRGKGVVIISPLPIRLDYLWASYGDDPATNPFTAADIRPDLTLFTGVAKKVAEEIGATFIDLIEFMRWYSDYQFYNPTALGLNNGIGYGDPIHVDATYGTAFGRYVATALSADNLICKKYARSGDEFQFRKGVDPVVVNFESSRNVQDEFKFNISRNSTHACGEVSSGASFRTLFMDTVGDTITWSFYADDGDLVASPVLFLYTGATVRCYHTFAAQPPRHVVDPSRSFTKGFGWNGDGTTAKDITASGSAISTIPSYRSASGFDTSSVVQKLDCYLVRSGWHSITVEVTSGVAMASGLVIGSLQDIKTQELEDRSLTIVGQAAIDMDNLVTSGNYYIGTDSTNTPSDSGATGWSVEVLQSSSSTVVKQTAFSSTGVLSIRQRLAGAWSSWVSINSDDTQYIEVPVDGDVETLVSPGLYTVGTGSTNVPPDGGATSWVIEVIATSSGSIVQQTATSNIGQFSTKQRRVGTWSSWVRVND